MTPRLFPGTATGFGSFNTQLRDCLSCTVTEERNGEFFLEMEYPADGENAGEIEVDKIIFAKPYEAAEAGEPFRITSINSGIDGRLKIYAPHISYRLNDIIVKPCSGELNTAASFWNLFVNSENRLGTNPFTFSSNVVLETAKKITNEKCSPLRTLLGGAENSILSQFGGELKWEGFTVNLRSSRGANRGVTIAYGKNITGLDYEIDLSEYWNGVVAYYVKDATKVNSSIQSVDDGLSYVRVITVDASSDFQSTPTGSQLNTWAQNYISKNYVSPRVTVKVSFVPLWQTAEYKDFYDLEFVQLCDTVKVKYPPLGTDLSAKVVKTVFDVIQERYTNIEIGTPSKNLADTVDGIIKELKKK